MRILVFGDSITQGFWDLEYGGWVERLRLGYDPENVKNVAGETRQFFNLGVSGDTTANIVKRFATETEYRRSLDHKLIFIFAIGLNDTLLRSEKPVSTPEMYAEALDTLFAAAGHYSDKVLFVGLTPCQETKTTPVAWDNSVTYTNARIRQFDKVLSDFCGTNKLPFAKVFEKYLAKQKQENLLVDGLHPNDAGHQLIADLVKPQLDDLIH